MKDDLIDQPTEDDVAELAARGVVAEVRTNFPAKIIEYDAATFTATIKPVLRQRRWDPNERKVVDYLPKAIFGCRVVQHYTDRGGMILPYKPGDYVWAECAERSIAEWRERGGDDVTPASTKRHKAIDAVVTGPIRARNTPPAADDVDADNPVFAGNPCKLGDATATSNVALDDLVEAEFDRVWRALESHNHTVPITGPAGTTPTTAPVGVLSPPFALRGSGTQASTSGSVGASKVKAK